MSSIVSADRFRFLLSRFRQRLWVKPLVVCLLSFAGAFVAKLADGTGMARMVPVISADSIEALLTIMAASMLVIATFSVASMVSAYASASNTATPRSFTLVIADDNSQNAFSTFVGAFIFSIVALTATMNDYFQTAGLFVLFVLMIFVLAIVIVTFVSWVDHIARLGRLGSTIDKVEQATAEALNRRRAMPTLGGIPLQSQSQAQGQPVFATRVGYVQHIDMAALQTWAEENDARVIVEALPGTFTSPGRALASVSVTGGSNAHIDRDGVINSFQIAGDRTFNDDPRFGLVVLSEIAGRALSPAVNDPGTAIDIIGTLLRLFSRWSEPVTGEEEQGVQFERIEVPLVSVRDMFDDAFTAIARDGAGAVEVAIRLQKAFSCLATSGDEDMCAAAKHHASLALKRAQIALTLEEDLDAVRQAAACVSDWQIAKQS